MPTNFTNQFVGFILFICTKMIIENTTLVIEKIVKVARTDEPNTTCHIKTCHRKLAHL